MMITKEDILAGKVKQTVKVLANGETGTGKTYFSMTYPKVAYLGTEPNGLDTAKSNPELLNNLVWADEFVNSPNEDIKVTFDRLDKAIDQIHKEHAEGKVETLVLDNFTYLSENRWIYINKYEASRSANGTIDTRGMYGTLARWLYNFTIMKILSFKGNVVLTCHIQTEGEEAMENKVDKSMTISPAILGGFRNMIGGMFSAAIYLEKKRLGDNKYMYLARCQKGGNKEAKNRYNLPEIVENVSYKTIIDSIGKGSMVQTVK
jgi:hypothetical protein